MATGLENLSKGESTLAAQALKTNAEALLATANAVAELGNYGVGRSLLILASEGTFNNIVGHTTQILKFTLKKLIEIVVLDYVLFYITYEYN
jgi:hypothetical protein